MLNSRTQGTTATFIIDENGSVDYTAVKSKDKLTARFSGEDVEHFAARWCKVYLYIISNTTKQTDYRVTFFRTRDERLLMASCECTAAAEFGKICKHIKRAYCVHRDALELGFIQE